MITSIALVQRSLLAAVLALVGCGGGGGGTAASAPASPVAPSAPVTPATGAPTAAPAGWRITIYYTPVLAFYSGPAQNVVGCPGLQCANGTASLGSFPADFVAAVKTEGTGKIAPGRYLNWSSNTGYWLDTLPRDAQGQPLMPYRSAAADPSIPFGTTLRIGSCGADSTTGTPTATAVCTSYSTPTWIVADRFTAGAVGRHVDLYVGDQTSATFTSSPSFIDASGAAISTTPPPSPTAMWRPTPADSFQWILSGALDFSASASVYDIDPYTSTAADVAKLHSLGRHAVCYVNAGAYEDFRPDASTFPAAVLGKAYTGWPGERWLDIRRIDLLGPILSARFDRCRSMGFDAIETDNVDGFQNATGFPLGADDQIVFNAWLASTAHERGLSIALKNDNTQVADLQPLFDFSLTEDCWQQGWCADMTPFHAAGKAVVTTEYTDVTTTATFLSTYCPRAKAAGFYALLKGRTLDAAVTTCP